eukprot:3202573-Amphidinium_carterae.2
MAPLFQSRKEPSAALLKHLPSNRDEAARKESIAVINKIAGQCSWETVSIPKAEESVVAMAAGTEAWRLGNFGCLESAWLASLIPERELLINKKNPANLWWVLKKYSAGVLVWPCDQLQERWVRLSSDVAEPTLLHVWNLEDEQWHIVPSTWKAPGTAREMGLNAACLSIRCTKPARPLLQYLCETGFAFVSEDSLGKLVARCELPLPSSEDDLSYRDVLALALMRHLQADMSNETAAKALLHGRLMERPEEEPAILEVDALKDALLLPGDQRDLDRYVEAADDALHANHTETLKARSMATAVQKKASGPTCSKRKVRWTIKTACTSESALGFIQKHGPDLGTCSVDASNGRLFIVFPEPIVQRKSISWHRRGWPSCVQLALTWLWERHSWNTGLVYELSFQDFPEQ